MVPTLQSDDLITVAPGRRCRLGDIALYQQDQDLWLHRVVARWGDWIATKGDGLAWVDAPVPRHAVLGTAVARERRVGCSGWTAWEPGSWGWPGA